MTQSHTVCILQRRSVLARFHRPPLPCLTSKPTAVFIVIRRSPRLRFAVPCAVSRLAFGFFAMRAGFFFVRLPIRAVLC